MTEIMTNVEVRIRLVDRQSSTRGVIARGSPDKIGKLVRTWNAVTFNLPIHLTIPVKLRPHLKQVEIYLMDNGITTSGRSSRSTLPATSCE
jgi:hypothetical protein